MIRKLSCMTAMMLMLSHGVAAAAEAVSARVAAHGNYGRVVFDWPAAVTYTASKKGDRIEISFARPGTMTKGAATGPYIAGLEQVAGGDQNLTVAIAAAPGTTFRHFSAGSRVIVDVIDPAAPAKKAAAAPPPAPAAPPAKTAEAPPPKAASAQAPAPVTEKQAPPAALAPPMPAKAVPEVVEEELAAMQAAGSAPGITDAIAGMPPHTVSVTTTESVGMAAFERFGTLWVVVDRPGFTVPPQISGPEKDTFPPFQRTDVKNGTVFRMKLPPGAADNLYGEGGGLVWRVIMTPQQRYDTPVLPQRTFDEAAQDRGGTITWPLRRVTKLVEVQDPDIGDTITVATVSDSSQNTGPRREFVDMAALNAPIGMAVMSKVDDLEIKQVPAGVQITRPGGLALSKVKDVSRQQIREQVQQMPVAAPGGFKRIFDFDRWMLGGEGTLSENQHILLAGMGNKDKNGKVQDLLSLAKMNIANDRGQEAMGFLNFAGMEMPEIASSPEFLALRGAAATLAGKYELAWKDLNDPVLQNYDEIHYWRAYTLAWLEDWKQAGEILPDSQSVLLTYPRSLLEKVGLKLAEVALRKNDVPHADALMAVLERSRPVLKPWTQAGLDYLQGQAARQKGDGAKTRALWEPLLAGKDDFYRARAGLALTMLELEGGNIVLDQAIDRLEGLRYAWRGDELEAQINFTLGKLYLQRKEYMKGFTILRDAAEISKDSDINREIKDYMAQAFMDLLMNNDDLSAEDAVMVYEEFKNLTPDSPEGNRLVQKLAERMVNADLLTRAGAILQHQVDFRVGGEEQARVAMRLAAIYLLDRDPKPAIAALDKAKAYYGPLTDEASQKQARFAELMRARALSQMNQTEEAIALLNGFPPEPDVNRLRADIAWQAGLWEDAAEALQDLIIDEGLADGDRPLAIDQADLILNRAVALNLSGNRVALANMQKRYGAAMKKTARARLFDVVTRPRKASIVADRDTIEQIVSEVDMFKDFLDDYKETKDLGTN